MKQGDVVEVTAPFFNGKVGHVAEVREGRIYSLKVKLEDTYTEGSTHTTLYKPDQVRKVL